MCEALVGSGRASRDLRRLSNPLGLTGFGLKISVIIVIAVLDSLPEKIPGTGIPPSFWSSLPSRP